MCLRWIQSAEYQSAFCASRFVLYTIRLQTPLYSQRDIYTTQIYKHNSMIKRKLACSANLSRFFPCVKIRRRSNALQRAIVLRSTSRGIALMRVQLTDYCRKLGNPDAKGFNSSRHTTHARNYFVIIPREETLLIAHTWYISLPKILEQKKETQRQRSISYYDFSEKFFSQLHNRNSVLKRARNYLIVKIVRFQFAAIENIVETLSRLIFREVRQLVRRETR